MVASSNRSPEEPPPQPVVLFCKTAGSSNETQAVRTGFDYICCGCTVGTCLMIWATFVLWTAIICLFDFISLLVLCRYQHAFGERTPRNVDTYDEIVDKRKLYYNPSPYISSHGLAILLCTLLTAIIVVISAALVMAAVSKKNFRLLKVSLYYIIATIIYFFLKTVLISVGIFLEDTSVHFQIYFFLIANWSGIWPIFVYIIIIVLIKRAMG